jgi:hypothetical protein
MAGDIAKLYEEKIGFMNQMLPEYGMGGDALRNYLRSRGSSLNPLDRNFDSQVIAERFRMDKSNASQATEPEARDTSELEKERQKLLDDSIQRGADRMTAMYANLGWGAPPPQYGELSTGEQLFPEGQREVPPAWAGLLSNPAVAQAVGQGGIPAAQPSLEEIVNARAEEIRTAAKGGLIKRYDLGGLVNNMLLQASRSRDNIPSNTVG